MNTDNEAERLPDIPASQQSAAQQQVAAALIQGPRGRLSGPFVALLRSPELCQRAQLLGEYLRFDSMVPQRLRELAILLTARHWRQNYEWQTHAPIAERVGLARSVIDDLAAGRPAAQLAADESIVSAFCTELHHSHGVSNGVYAQACDLLGEQGVIELCGICGYYSLLAMVLNVARTAVPPGGDAPFLSP